MKLFRGQTTHMPALGRLCGLEMRYRPSVSGGDLNAATYGSIRIRRLDLTFLSEGGSRVDLVLNGE